MKKMFPLLVLSITLSTHTILAQAPTKSSSDPAKGRYPFETGEVTYKISGDAEGSATLIFDTQGWRSKEIREMTFSRYGIQSTEKRLEQRDGEKLYKADLVGKKGTISKERTLLSLMGYKEKEVALKTFYESKGGSLISTDTILTYQCNKWEFTRGSIAALWEHEGLPLKIIKKVPGITYTQEAIVIDQKISEGNFTLPEDIIWK